MVHKCEASSNKTSNVNLKCNYIEFGEKLSIKFTGELDPSIAEFWNEIDHTMVKRTKPIEVIQVYRADPAHQSFA